MSARTARKDHRRWMLFEHSPTVDKANYKAVVQYWKDKKAGKDTEKVRPKWRKGWEDLPTYGNLNIILDHFSRLFRPYSAPHSPCNMPCRVRVLVGR